MGRTLKIFFLALAAAMLFSTSANAGPLEDIRKAQEGVSTVKAAFEQEKHTELLDRPIRSEGMFYFKSPVGVRWEYGDEMVVVYDGSTLYIHYVELGEAEKIKGVAGFVGPLSFDLKTLLKDYEVNTENAGGEVVLHLKPKKRMPFESMDMFFKPAAPFPHRVRIIEETGDVTVIKFHDIKINVELPSGLFRFTPPPGVEVRDRELR